MSVISIVKTYKGHYTMSYEQTHNKSYRVSLVFNQDKQPPIELEARYVANYAPMLNQALLWTQHVAQVAHGVATLPVLEELGYADKT